MPIPGKTSMQAAPIRLSTGLVHRGLLWWAGWLGMVICLTWPLDLGADGERRFDHLISASAHQHQLEPALLKAVIKCESGFDPLAISPRGARGLMQLMPATQALLGVLDAFDPSHNIRAGAQYVAMLQQTFGNQVSLVLAAYNAGPQAVIAAGYAVPPFAETQRYVRCVLAARNDYRQSGINEQVFASQTSVPSEDEPSDLLIAPLRLSHAVARVGQPVTMRLEVQHGGAQLAHGVVILTYPESLVSLIALHTSEHQTTVRLPDAPDGRTIRATWAAPAYRFLRGAWPAWRGSSRASGRSLRPMDS